MTADTLASLRDHTTAQEQSTQSIHSVEVHICNQVHNYLVVAYKTDEIILTVSHVALSDDFKQISSKPTTYLMPSLQFRIWHFKIIWKAGGKTLKRKNKVKSIILSKKL